MRRLVLLAAIIAAGCLNENACFSQTQTMVGPSGASSPGASGGACEPAARLELRVVGGGEIKAGSVERADLTAYTASGQEITGQCAASKAATWSSWAGPCEWLSSPTGYNPEFRGTNLGTCSTTAQLEAVRAELSVRVVP